MENMCSCQVIHEEAVERVRSVLAGEFELLEMAEMFKVLGDATRLKIINALLISELCVCDVAAVMGMSHPAVSHHLKILRQTRLVRCRKEGKIVYYALCDDHVGMLFDQCKKHVGEE
ncbi:MAG: metalloregulator ArsR/SmtB family transcription factor [Victivallaceae bacterium]|nr:metalloregulator ArsR/SmtB family transcription factor [Victivallaceae bacterium]